MAAPIAAEVTQGSTKLGRMVSLPKFSVVRTSIALYHSLQPILKCEKSRMFRHRTLFIVGAGASAEVGMPAGRHLAKSIGNKMDIRFEIGGAKQVGIGDMHLFSQIRHIYQTEAQEYHQAAWLIRDGIGLSQSIDDFLDLHRSNERINRYGKAAIVKSLLEAETNSKLYFDSSSGIHRFNPDPVADTWLVKFMHMLGRGVPKENRREIFDNVSFIIFNYDRCVEYFLLHALQNLYGISEEEASGILDDLRIIHPFGLIGELARPTCREGVTFGGADPLSTNYIRLADNIKTYTEQIAAAELLAQIEAEVQKADCIVFLGFAYHSQNMRLLTPTTTMDYKRVFGTAYKMSNADTDVVLHQISDFFNPSIAAQMREQIRLENKITSAELFDAYAKSLTGGD